MMSNSFDVIVVGGGPAGLCAAIAAARNGAHTLLVESCGFLGGNAATGVPWASFSDGKRQIVWGIASEFAGRLRERGGLAADLARERWIPLDPECVRLVADEMVTEVGAAALLHTMGADAIVENGVVRGVSIENKGGRQRVLSKVVVDCSGDADIAYRAGVPCAVGRDSDHKTQPQTMMFMVGGADVERFEAECGYVVMIEKFTEIAEKCGFENPRRKELSGMFYIPGRPGQVCFNVTRVLGCSAVDPLELSDAERCGRRQVWEFVHRFLRPHVPGFEQAYLSSTAPFIGVRETRRIKGKYVFSKEDVAEYREHDDAIGRGSYPVDIHSPTGASTDYQPATRKPGCSYTIPFSIMLPEAIEGLLVAGRCISATHEGLSAIRVQPNCMIMGQAAGTAAALCVKDGSMPRGLSVKSLQDQLVSDGVLLERP